MPLLIDFIRIRRPTFVIQLRMQVVNRRCLHPVKLPLSYRSIHIDWVFHSRLALIYEYLLRALLVLFESADSVIMFGGFRVSLGLVLIILRGTLSLQ